MLMLFHNAPEEVCAVSLDKVLRLEKIQNGQIEMLGGKRSMQYRKHQLPLIALQDRAHVGLLDKDAEQIVLVMEHNGHEVGLLGAMPTDIVEERIKMDHVHKQQGIVGSSIIRGKTTLMIDAEELFSDLYRIEKKKHAIGRKSDLTSTEKIWDATILLAEDSDFFRKQIALFLEESGFKVITAHDGESAWGLLQKKSTQVNIVVTDVEMPRMNGLELTQKIRRSKEYSDLPIIAVTTLAEEEDVRRGKDAGVNEYLVKLDKAALLESIKNILQFDSKILNQDRDGE
jgi:two-component system, chemotaxis family, sensor kinase CheA